MKQILKYTLFMAFAVALSSCQKEDDLRSESVISVVETHESEFDTWLFETFTKPYNMEIKWKWDDGEVDNNFHVIPPQKEKAEAFMKALYKIWIEPYEAEGGTEFIKTYAPKLIYLVGTPQYNTDGTMTVGLAEGGRKVTVFDVDRFDNTNLDQMTHSFHTLHHEFAHILHQKVLFSTDFKMMSQGLYTGAWYNNDTFTANAYGFITPYAMSKDVEDWVEIVATILTEVQHSNEPIEYIVPELDENGFLVVDETGKLRTFKQWHSQFSHKITMLGIWEQKSGTKIIYTQHPNGPQGQQKLLQKIDMVLSYYNGVWEMDLMRLQKRIERATQALIEENAPVEE